MRRAEQRECRQQADTGDVCTVGAFPCYAGSATCTTLECYVPEPIAPSVASRLRSVSDMLSATRKAKEGRHTDASWLQRSAGREAV